eukprot:jgi/Ulvmu1/3506/UM162_0013.1
MHGCGALSMGHVPDWPPCAVHFDQGCILALQVKACMRSALILPMVGHGRTQHLAVPRPDQTGAVGSRCAQHMALSMHVAGSKQHTESSLLAACADECCNAMLRMLRGAAILECFQ